MLSFDDEELASISELAEAYRAEYASTFCSWWRAELPDTRRKSTAPVWSTVSPAKPNGITPLPSSANITNDLISLITAIAPISGNSQIAIVAALPREARYEKQYRSDLRRPHCCVR